SGGQQPDAHVLGPWDEAQPEKETCHEDQLHEEAQDLNFAPFFDHAPILQVDFSKINRKQKNALFL
ncbi:MAG: hypothetical protein IKY91_00480, partial [Akkermansia sp.]|nr:hypothetical protein [Akkermansia sp.]